MNTDDYPVQEVLSEGRRFMVPLYQRKYQWGDDRLNPFWEDVQSKAVEVLEGNAKFMHYMGALLLAPVEKSQIGVTPSVQVVDGQQRLTTFQLFLAALREVAKSCEFPHIVENANEYLFNALRSKDIDPLTKFKLTPTPSDRGLFHDIIEKNYADIKKKYERDYWGAGIPKNSPLKALRAYEVFRDKINFFVNYGPEDEEYDASSAPEKTEDFSIKELRIEALLKAVLERMKLVVITLDDDDDAQVIFESLNSKGEPLLAMDLVRNNIFHRAEKQTESVETLYRELWDPFDHNWWKEKAPNARPVRPRIDHFLSHILAAETGANISMRELYAEYRGFAMHKGKPRFEHVEDELHLLKRYMPLYETLEGRINENSTIHWLGRKLACWQITTAYPVALQIASEKVSQSDREGIARLIYSYVVRRALCGMTSKGLNRIFQSLSQVFVEKGPSLEAANAFFLSKNGPSALFPSNTDVVDGCLTKRLYENAPGNRNKDILWELEKAIRPRFAEDVAMPGGLQTEHIMPRGWNESWPFLDGSTDHHESSSDKSRERRDLIHTLGNLTLITAGLNQSIGNASYSDKLVMYREHASLFLNKKLPDVSMWNESHIRDRSRQLAEVVIKVWPDLNRT